MKLCLRIITAEHKTHCRLTLMAILQSCCCWQSVRQGSYASAIYTLIYFFITSVIMGITIIHDIAYLKGNVSEPHATSIMEPNGVSRTTIIFYMVLVVISTIGTVSSICLIIGLYIDNRYLLIPWIVAVILFSTADLTNSVYLFTLDDSDFNPITGILFTVELFLFVLNIYALLCVISQYQEYRAGRGTADFNNFLYTIPSIRYSQQPTATSCLSTSRRITTSQLNESPSKFSPSARSSIATTKRHVQFPDNILLDAEKSDFFWSAEPHNPKESPSNGDSETGSVALIKVEAESVPKWNKNSRKNQSSRQRPAYQ